MTTNIATLTGQNLATLTALCAESGVPGIIWADPGVGKSAMIEALSASLDRHCEVVIASLYEPTDFSGLPVVVDGRVRRAAPEWAVRCAESERSLLFLDEISQAAPAVQAATMRVVLNRMVGDLHLGAGCAVLAAANPPDVAAGGWEIALPLANRFMHVQAGLDAQDVVAGFTTGWAQSTVTRLPKGWEAGKVRWLATVASFLRKRPALVHTMPKDGTSGVLAFATPRSWDATATFLAAASSVGLTMRDTVVAAGVQGLTGAAGIEFLTWALTQDLGDPEDILAAPTTAPIPVRGDQIAAVLDAVVAAAATDRKDRKARIGAAWTYLARVAETQVDIAVPAKMGHARTTTAAKCSVPEAAAAFRPVLVRAGLVPA